MKKVLVVCAVLMLAMPVLAVTITPTGTTTSKPVLVKYDANSEGLTGSRVRAMALDITVNNGAVISSFTDLQGTGATAYWVHPGSIDINSNTGAIIGYGNMIGDPCHSSPYPNTQHGSGTSGITVEMASLYTGSGNAPPTGGKLFTFMVNKACTVTITQNAIRGGIVMEDPTVTPTVTLNTVNITAPGCATCMGDLNGDGYIRTNDLGLMASAWIVASTNKISSTSPQWNNCADVTCDGYIRTNDYGQIATLFILKSTTKVACSSLSSGWPCHPAPNE